MFVCMGGGGDKRSAVGCATCYRVTTRTSSIFWAVQAILHDASDALAARTIGEEDDTFEDGATD